MISHPLVLECNVPGRLGEDTNLFLHYNRHQTVYIPEDRGFTKVGAFSSFFLQGEWEKQTQLLAYNQDNDRKD